MEIALVRAGTHTPLRRGCKTQPQLTSPTHHSRTGARLGAARLQSSFLFPKQWTCAFPSWKVLPKCKRDGCSKGMWHQRFKPAKVTCRVVVRGAKNQIIAKGWFQLHFSAGPVFICAGWQGKGQPFMCWLPTKAEGAHAGREAGLSWVSEHPNSPKTSGLPEAAIHPRLTQGERSWGLPSATMSPQCPVGMVTHP